MRRPRLSTAWFLPRSFDVLGMLRAQLELVEQSMGVLTGWGHGEVAIHDAAAELRVIAGAERVARSDLYNAVRDSFSTPIEAEDLFELGGTARRDHRGRICAAPRVGAVVFGADRCR